MNARRQTQHRPQREERKTKEVQELKGENHRLARENARLKKELTKALQTKSEFEGDEAPEALELPVEQTPCPDCGAGNVRRVSLAGHDYAICPECKWRKRVE